MKFRSNAPGYSKEKKDMEIIEKFRELAKNKKKTIVLPEGEDEVK